MRTLPPCFMPKNSPRSSQMIPLLTIALVSLLTTGAAMAAATNIGFGARVLMPVKSDQVLHLVRTHRCGNGKVEYRETCDDRNRISGDGCSRWCQVERRSELQACGASTQCPTGQYCTTADGDCRSACPPGAMMCTQVCMGICRPISNCTAYCTDGTPYNSCAMGPMNPCIGHESSSK